MHKLLAKRILKRELTLFHFLLLTTGKLAVGAGVGILIANFAFDYSYPLIIMGVLILLPTFFVLFMKEETAEEALAKKIRKR